MMAEKNGPTTLQNRTAADIMTSPAVTIASNATVREALQKMRDQDIRRLAAVEPDGKLIGLISYDDVRVAYSHAHVNGSDMTVIYPQVREYLPAHLHYVKRDASLHDVIDTMLQFKLRALPVCDNGAIAGIITETDILKVLKTLLD